MEGLYLRASIQLLLSSTDQLPFHKASKARPQGQHRTIRMLDKGYKISYKCSERIKRSLTRPYNLGKTEVHDLKVSNISWLSHENILRFKISMGDTEGVKIIEGSSKLMSDYLSSLLRDCEFSFF